jgi:hypothetical protein
MKYDMREDLVWKPYFFFSADSFAIIIIIIIAVCIQ